MTDDQLKRLKRLNKRQSKLTDEIFNLLQPLVEESLTNSDVAKRFIEQTINIDIAQYDRNTLIRLRKNEVR